MQLNEKTIFLLDGIGAALSALGVGVLAPAFSEWIGLPPAIAYALALLGAAFAVYSLSRYWFVTRIRPWMLMTIICANLLYCAISAIIVLKLNALTVLGRAYFVFEICVIVGVVLIETRIYSRMTSGHSNL